VALVRERVAGLVPSKEAHAQIVLQCRDAPAHRRLADAQIGRRACQAAGAGHAEEVAQISPVHEFFVSAKRSADLVRFLA
jgi:hypothetical protein